jgi:hypothetical protein
MSAGAGTVVAGDLDTAALTGPIDRSALREFRRGLPASIRPSVGSVVLPALAVLLACGLLIAFGRSLIGDQFSLASVTDDWVGFGFVLVPYVGLPAVLIVYAVRALVARSGRRQYRLARFAAANGLRYEATAGTVVLPGMIFGIGSDASARDLVHGPAGLVVGNHRYVTGSGKNRRTHRWGFAALSLGTTLPHIVLDARSNNSVLGASNLPVPFDRAQRLSLEGDFDQHFTLYCPAGYERDALYMFTPDIMARFIDRAAEFDVEIVDDRLFLYSRRDLSTLDPETWRWLWVTLEALTAKLAQWQRWRDDRLGTTTVSTGSGSPALGSTSSASPGPGSTGFPGSAPQIVRPPKGVHRSGRRLQQKTHWIWIVIAIALVAFGAFNLVTDILHTLW